jgi:ATP-dependent Clp protease protease subunit
MTERRGPGPGGFTVPSGTSPGSFPPGWRPGASQAQDWLSGELFERRVVFVTGHLDSLLAVRTAAELMTLDASGADPIDVYIGSPDGTLEAAFTLIDTLDLVQAPTRTHALGEVGGAAVGILAVGRRHTAAPHAQLRLGEPRVQLAGTHAQLLAAREQHQRLLERFRARLAQATGRSIAELAQDMERGRYLNAEEALAYGLIDAIADRPI